MRDVHGEVVVYGNTYADAFQQLSDERFKTNIEPVTDALGTISKLQGYTYDWKRSSNPGMNFSEGRQIGLIAQQVRTAAPQMVSTDRNGHLTVQYQSAIPLLIEALKQLEKENQDLRARLDELSARK